MIKKLRVQEQRTDKRRRAGEPQGKWVLEAIDVALVAAIAAILIWLQWMLQGAAG